MMYRTDDPIADFHRHDAEQYKSLESSECCDKCGDVIQDDHYYNIDGQIYCPSCIDDCRVWL
jgi:formylmethanofuran dehydrogenase subunit E